MHTEEAYIQLKKAPYEHRVEHRNKFEICWLIKLINSFVSQNATHLRIFDGNFKSFPKEFALFSCSVPLAYQLPHPSIQTH